MFIVISGLIITIFNLIKNNYQKEWQRNDLSKFLLKKNLLYVNQGIYPLNKSRIVYSITKRCVVKDNNWMPEIVESQQAIVCDAKQKVPWEISTGTGVTVILLRSLVHQRNSSKIFL